MLTDSGFKTIPLPLSQDKKMPVMNFHISLEAGFVMGVDLTLLLLCRFSIGNAGSGVLFFL